MTSSVAKFMSQKTDSQQIKLPDHEMITLCEAVTAFVIGKASDSFDYGLFHETESEEERAKAKNLVERLHGEAYAGRIRFRALKNGDNPVDGYKEIDPLYFSKRRGLRWDCDEIWASGLSPRRPTFESQGRFTMDWHDVHLDREGFEALLRKMGSSSVQQQSDADVPGDQYKTGLAGRRSSIHFILAMAHNRLESGDYPDTLTKFSEQLAEELARTHPQAPPATPKTIRNNSKVRELWRRKTPKIIDPS
jgi:hypothetical protein